MTPPAVHVGWEFVQSEPEIYKGVTFPAAGGLAGVAPASASKMLGYKMRLRLIANVQVYIKAQFYINNLIYNSLVFDLNKFLSFAFADLTFVYADQAASTTELPIVYNDMNLCFNYGYNYQAISMQVKTSIKYPSCYKTII